MITVVYGPTNLALKDDFFRELVDLKPSPGTNWIALGDFNQIGRSRDKNNNNIDQTRIKKFRDTLTNCDLKGIHL
jgi:hypothetical protein